MYTILACDLWQMVAAQGVAQPTPGVANPPLQPQIKEADSSFRREWQVIDLNVMPETIVLLD